MIRLAIALSVLVFSVGACGSGGGDADMGGQDAAQADVGSEVTADVVDASDSASADIGGGGDLIPADASDVADSSVDSQGKDVEDVVVDACTPKAPLSENTKFNLSGLVVPDGEGPETTGVMEAATVTAKGYYQTASGWGSEIGFLTDSGSEVVAKSELPFDYEIPVAVGQPVWIFARQEQGFGHRNLVFVVWDVPTGGAGGLPIFFLHDAAKSGDPPWYECDKKKPCPSATQVYDECPAAPVECGAAQYPPVELMMHGGLSSGEAVKPLRQGDTTVAFGGHRYVNVRSYHYTDMFCLDYPGDWTSAFIGKSTYSSQCRCMDDSDCAGHQICETSMGKCFVNRCTKEHLGAAGANCKEGYICDPFTGTCKQPIPPPDPCKVDGDCSGGKLCNHGLRFCTGANECSQVMSGCVIDQCADMDCDGFCNGLSGVCGHCIADCDCARSSLGDFCGETFDCADCDFSKIGFGRENPVMYELYYLCVKKNGVDPEIELKTIDPSITCGTGGGPAKCDPASEVGCSGTLEFVPGTKWVSKRKYGWLCKIAGLSWVNRMVGGHYL